MYLHATDVRYHLDCMLVGSGLLVWCNCNNHNYYTGPLQVRLEQHRWLDIAKTNMNVGQVQVYQTYMLVGASLTDMTAG